MKLFSFLFFLAFLVIPKTGQAEDLARFFPTESLIYVGSSGVGELDDAFNKSKAGKLWNQPRFESLRNFLEKLPKQISDSFNARGNSDHDEIPALSPFEDFINMQAGLLPGLADAMQHGVAFGIADIIIDPIEPEVIAYLIIDAGDESERYKNVFARNLMGLALTDPRIELLNEISWTVLEIEAQPAAELWWTIHENRAIFALGSTSARTYLAMSNGERTSMLEDEIYKAGMYRCIGNSSVTSSIQIDLPGIVGLVLDTFQEFGGDPPAEADYFIDEISRIGALHYASGHTNGDEPVFTAGTSFPYKGISVPATGITDESLALAPRSPLFLSAIQYNLQESYQQLETILGSFLPEEQSWQIDQGKKTLNAMLGISIDDLIVALGRQLLIFEESSARGIMPAAVVAISGGNPQVIENSVIRLFPFLQILARSSGVSVSLRSHSVEIKDTKYKIGYIQTANLEAPITPAWTTYDGNLLMALHPTVLEQVLHRVTAEDREHFIIPDDFKHPLILCVRPAISYSFIDVEEVLRWSWPTLVPILQYGIGKNKLPIDTVAMPSAYLFKDWKLQNKSWIDEDGYRSTSNTPVPLGIDGLGGLIFDFIATTLERNGPRDVISEEEAEDPFAEDPVVEEALEKPETEKKPL